MPVVALPNYPSHDTLFITSVKLRRLLLPPEHLFTLSAEALTPQGRLDRSEFTADKVNLGFIAKHCARTGKYIGRSGYNRGTQYIYRGIKFELLEGPWNPASRRYKICINPRKFRKTRARGYGEFCHSLFARYGRYELNRLDWSVLFDDDPFSVDLIHDTLYVKDKQISEWRGSLESFLQQQSGIGVRYRSGIKTGFVLGGTCERNKAYHCGSKRRGYEEPIKNKINLEIQWEKDTCEKYGMIQLEDLQSSVGCDPFKQFRFYNIYSINPGLSTRKKLRAYELQLLSLRNGYHVAHAMLNRQRNFDKTYKGLFEELRVGKEAVLLHELAAKGFREGMKEFFKE